MTSTTTTMTKPRKPGVSKPDPELHPGDAVLFADGGEALVIGVEGGEALLRCGIMHDTPFRLPLDLVSKVAKEDETQRHYRYRVEAHRRGELKGL
jgi:hypothetical protein